MTFAVSSPILLPMFDPDAHLPRPNRSLIYFGACIIARLRLAREKQLNVRVVPTITAIDESVERLHSLGTYTWNLTNFLDPNENSLLAIRGAWRDLLYGFEDVEKRIAKCDQSLRNFGRSSIQELVGWHSPEKYPIKNNNTDAGMLFFGYTP